MVENAIQPVAWQYRIINKFGETEWTNCSLLEFDHFQKQDDDPFFGRYEVRPLYASPQSPQSSQQPLTDERIANIVREAAKNSAIRRDGGTSHRIVRAVEAAHGIKEQK